MTGSLYEGLGYPAAGVQTAATKPVSGESIVTFSERMDAIAEHGTKRGYDDGCRGSHCPGRDVVGMSCSQASIRYAGDMSYRRRVDAGLSAEAIWADDQLDGTVMPRVNTKDTRTVEQWADGQVTFADSLAAVEADEDFEAEEARESVPQQQPESVAVSPGERPAAAARERGCEPGRASRSSTGTQVGGQTRLGRCSPGRETARAVPVAAGGGRVRG